MDTCFPPIQCRLIEPTHRVASDLPRSESLYRLFRERYPPGSGWTHCYLCDKQQNAGRGTIGKPRRTPSSTAFRATGGENAFNTILERTETRGRSILARECIRHAKGKRILFLFCYARCQANCADLLRQILRAWTRHLEVPCVHTLMRTAR
jgi:hypothetical protein